MQTTHSTFIGYLLWIFGFTGSHRFYFGKKITGTIWLCTGGLFLVGWLVDVFLIPSMDRQADRRYMVGSVSYDLAWIFLTYLGFLGLHRMYMGKWVSGFLYLFTLGFLGIGIAYDFFTLNEQVSEINQARKG